MDSSRKDAHRVKATVAYGVAIACYSVVAEQVDGCHRQPVTLGIQSAQSPIRESGPSAAAASRTGNNNKIAQYSDAQQRLWTRLLGSHKVSDRPWTPSCVRCAIMTQWTTGLLCHVKGGI